MAYALVVNLMQTLEPLLDSVRSKFHIPNSVLKPIFLDLCYLKSFFDKMNSLEDSNSVEEVEMEIKDVLQNAQDLIESHLSDLVHSGSQSSKSGFSRELVKIKKKLGPFIKTLKAKEDFLTGDQQQSGRFAADADVSSTTDFGSNNKIVGLDYEIVGLLDRITRGYGRSVIHVVGMAGIGKTTLVKQAYRHPFIAEHFDLRFFVEIGVQYQFSKLLLRLLGHAVFNSEEMTKEKDKELGFSLHKYLVGRRYLVVLDDIWDTRALTELQRFLPDQDNGSAIIFTSRLINMVPNEFHQVEIFHKRFMSDNESWDLLREMVFSEEMCPAELEGIGRTIAKILGGLPLAIVEIGNLLHNSPLTAGSWMAVAENINPFIQETIIPWILKPSYAQLPQHLKACFLYLGIFQPNYNIPTCQLFNLWLAEGFIEPVADKSLEEKAQEYLLDLVSRSLVIVHELSSSGRIRCCRIHLVLQDLCVREAQQEKLFHIVKEGTVDSLEGTKDQRRLGIYRDVMLASKESVLGRDRDVMRASKETVSDRDGSRLKWLEEPRQCRRNFGAIFRDFIKRKFVWRAYAPQSLGVDTPLVSGVRSLVFICAQNQHPLEVNLGLRWLRVLHAPSFICLMFPDQVVKLVRLRYLAITYDGELPPSISRLRNLEFLIIHRSQSIESYVFLPLEIWRLHKLRHLECMGFDLPDPSAAAPTAHGNVLLHLRKLVTLSGVSARSCNDGVLARTPNLIKLGVWFQPTDHKVELFCFHAVSSCLHRLQSFKCTVTAMNRGLGSQYAFPPNGFCYGLIKLTLSGCGFVWSEHMTIISKLPNLQVLKLKWHAFRGSEWVTEEGGFLRLKCLVLEDLDVENWEADCSHFPRLETLHIRRCNKLLEIPEDIGDISTLEVIVVDDCGESLIHSARLMQEYLTEMYGDSSVQFRFHSSADG